jgi:hypothetical protein
MKNVKSTPVTVFFVDYTDQSIDPVLVGKVTSLSPTFENGEKITLKKIKEGEIFVANIFGKNATHTIQGLHWIFTALEGEEDQVDSDLSASLVVNLQQIKEIKELF